MSTFSSPAGPETGSESDDLLIVEDDEADNSEHKPTQPHWRVLVVDDDPEVHSATRFAVGESAIIGRKLELLSAFSAAEGRKILEENSDIAVILLDVVMEEHDAGLKFVEWMRARGYEKQRVILRTGQPGYAPELDVIRNYDINDYRTKSELTQTRLITSMTSAIRTFEQFWLVERQRLDMENFAYALAHDFKQTTRQIRTYSEMVARSYDEEDASGAPKALSFLSGAARRLAALVDTMSNYTLMGRPTEVTPIDVESIFADVRAAVDPMLKETGGELSLSGSGVLLANGPMIVHTLHILIANGLQHNESATPHVDVKVSIFGDACQIAVHDNGVGIEPEYVEQVFQPSTRLRNAGEAPGMGLGLTLSRRAIESQGGAIWCESKPGAGSSFFVTLPNGATATSSEGAQRAA